ncbi:lysoplasmalogenase [Pradoshia eiseniae]|uniref:Lysoplasmalogenase n=1 Tax=Pradoshia eiseniae TaxID=2064768 RepID=A0A2S7MWD8_9BACI|nr:lysoplasmalogenase [Pradoshia eiseniae]PQD94094.1 lysoplasmalogenase [Pradoshia eiseniae]
MKLKYLSILILLMSIIYIFFIPSEPFALKILFKLIPMWLIIYFAFIQKTEGVRQNKGLILFGLFFCMLGDGLLHWFVIGLSCFLIGHIIYTFGFFKQWSFSKLRCLSILPLFVFDLFMGKKLVTSLQLSGEEELIVPVLFYIGAISIMAWAAFMTGNLYAIIGSLLFVISDTILSWNMFISDVPYSHFLIMATYYSAQYCIASSIRTTSMQSGIG